MTPLKPVSVFARTVSSKTGADYYYSAVINFGNDASAVLSGAAGLPKYCPPQLDLTIYGSEGMMLLDVEPDGNVYNSDVSIKKTSSFKLKRMAELVLILHKSR